MPSQHLNNSTRHANPKLYGIVDKMRRVAQIETWREWEAKGCLSVTPMEMAYNLNRIHGKTGTYREREARRPIRISCEHCKPNE